VNAGSRLAASAAYASVESAVAELPGIAAIGVVHQLRRIIDIALGQMVREHIRRLNNVIINADQDHVVLVHACSFRQAPASPIPVMFPAEETNFSPHEINVRKPP
jgi:hypothetical protein